MRQWTKTCAKPQMPGGGESLVQSLPLLVQAFVLVSLMKRHAKLGRSNV